MSRLRLDQITLLRNGRECLRAVDLSVAAAQVVAIVGPNGAGKSSLLKVAAGEWPASAGQVQLDGRALTDWSLLERARRMAVLPQQASLAFPFAVEEVVALGRMPHSSGRERDRHCVDSALDMFDLGSLRHKLYTQLSGGERQRVQLARVFAQVWPEDVASAPGLLLLDEPTAALDWAHQLHLLQNVHDFARRGMSILIVLHDLNLALRFADQVALLEQGELAAFGAPQQVLTPQRIAQVFQVDVAIAAHPRDGHPVIIQ
jgi:iron complex transport system ATP-binding protein